MIGCTCKTCLSPDHRDKRLRVSALIEVNGKIILIDTSADFRQQMLLHNVTRIDGILYTHSHYDHISGFDDLRAFQFLHRKAPRCYATEETFAHIRDTFKYAFGAAVQSGGGLPEVAFEVVATDSFEVEGVTVQPVPLKHGKLNILGYRIGNFAYLTDCSDIPETSYTQLHGLDVLVLDGLRYKQHPTHLTIDEAASIADRIGARQTYLTHMNHDVLHSEAELHLPSHVRLGYDNLSFQIT